MNSYSNKSILIDLEKLQINTDSNDNRNCSSIKQHEITFNSFSVGHFTYNDKNELINKIILLQYLSFVTLINCPLNSQNGSSELIIMHLLVRFLMKILFYKVPKTNNTQ
ncbi:unnamed protein product [Adineta steineri]|nr:unnamed protein product [Adineta steineri]CAF1292076.1 unnamed protein product [Adineta steineri]CAF1455530.1 unnamed protein product [Adineta steineri]CAF3771013.1 unnamed protein product [Adineta steineri]CAF3906646.1 unnamed protein product [Adineta steineri]